MNTEEPTTKELVETKAGGEVAAPMDLSQMFAQDSGQGLENVRSGDVAIPFLSILQKNSPQCEEGNGKYIAGAKPGMFLNTVTNAVFDGKTGVLVMPCGYEKKYVEWVPRDSGGGFVAAYAVDDEVVDKVLNSGKRNEKGRPQTDAGNDLIETAYHYALVIVNGEPQQVVIGMTSTALKASRQWNTLTAGKKIRIGDKILTPPVWGYVYKLTTALATKDQYSWQSLRVEDVGRLDVQFKDAATASALYLSGKEFHEAVAGGRVQVNPAAQQDVEEPVGGEGQAAEKTVGTTF